MVTAAWSAGWMYALYSAGRSEVKISWLACVLLHPLKPSDARRVAGKWAILYEHVLRSTFQWPAGLLCILGSAIQAGPGLSGTLEYWFPHSSLRHSIPLGNVSWQINPQMVQVLIKCIYIINVFLSVYPFLICEMFYDFSSFSRQEKQVWNQLLWGAFNAPMEGKGVSGPHRLHSIQLRLDLGAILGKEVSSFLIAASLWTKAGGWIEV